MMQHYRLLAWFAFLTTLISLTQPARADKSLAKIDLATFTCQEHTDTYNGGPKSNEYTSDRQVYFMIWLTGHEDPAKKGIDPKEIMAIAAGVLKVCGNNPELKVVDAFKRTAVGARPKTSNWTETAKFPCFLLAAVSTGNGDNDAIKTLVAWLSGQSAARANETVFDFDKFKNETSAVLAYCSDAKNKKSAIGTALQALSK